MLREATSVILYRRNPALELFLVLRSPDLSFLGGYHVFPGGQVETTDQLVPLRSGETMSPADRGAIGCGLRELLEETGLLAVDESGPEPGDWHATRQRLDEGADGVELFDRMRAEGLEVDSGVWTEALRLVTPKFSRIRFDTRFFFVAANGEPRISPGELTSGSWWRPQDALEAWLRGEIFVAPPANVILRSLATHDTLTAVCDELRNTPPEFEGCGHAIPWGPGIDLVPLPSPPLPASIPTTTFILGERRVFVVDPAPGGAAEQAHLTAVLEERRTRGDELEAIVLSHHHVDHVGAVAKLEERFELPVWAHARTGELLERDLDRTLSDGDTIDLGSSPDGRPDWHVECLFTPGHAQGHLALFDTRHGALLAGDLLSTLLSMYVGAPGGHLETYCQSLRRIRELPVRILYPSHGPPTLRPIELIDKALAHHRRRVEQIAKALLQGEGVTREVAARVHDVGTDARLQPLFECSTRAALDFLVENNRAKRTGEDRYRSL